MHPYLAQCQSFKRKKNSLSAINHGESLTKPDESLTVHLYIIDTQYLHKEKTHCVCMRVLPVYVLQIYKIELSH